MASQRDQCMVTETNFNVSNLDDGVVWKGAGESKVVAHNDAAYNAHAEYGKTDVAHECNGRVRSGETTQAAGSGGDSLVKRKMCCANHAK